MCILYLSYIFSAGFSVAKAAIYMHIVRCLLAFFGPYKIHRGWMRGKLGEHSRGKRSACGHFLQRTSF